jgi:hypothetical protein
MTVPTSAPTAPGLAKIVLHHVRTPQGGTLDVMGDAERNWYEQQRDLYMSQNDYTQASDIAELDRLLLMELMVFRWSQWLASGKEYDGTLIDDPTRLRRATQDFSVQILKIKEGLRLDRKAREADTGETFADRWQWLTRHAKQLGVTRERQLGVALELMNEIFSIISIYDRCNAEERKKLELDDEAAVVEHIRALRPRYDEVDEHFRTHQQRFWIAAPHQAPVVAAPPAVAPSWPGPTPATP